MYDRHTFAAEYRSALHVADDLDADGDLEIAVCEESTFLTLVQVKKLYDHLERVIIEANRPTPPALAVA